MTSKLSFVLILVFSIATFSCKKGDEDPALSLLTRKSRLAGEWVLSSLNASGSTNTSEYTKYTELNTIKTISSNAYVASEIVETIKAHDLIINKDGTWEKVIDVDLVAEETSKTSPYKKKTEVPKTITQSGTWAFVGATKGAYKNKERVIFNVTESKTEFGAGVITESYSDGSGPTTETETNPAVYSYTKTPGEFQATYDLVMLKSKEMKWSLVSASNITDVQYNADGEITEQTDYSNSFSETIVWESK